jgi:gluconate 2-dehydrogenase gamma chain
VRSKVVRHVRARFERGSIRTASSGADYEPHFFDAKEWAFIHAAVDRLIPADSVGPGGVEAGVPEFIDRQMETPYAHGALWYMQAPFTQGAPELGYQLKLVPRDLYRLGIAAVNAYCTKTYARSFDALDAATRDTVLGALEKGKVDLENVPAEVFFGQVLLLVAGFVLIDLATSIESFSRREIERRSFWKDMVGYAY